MVAALLNMPFGAAREHTHKFSPQWFLAVHATIPLIAPLRKAVLMPRWAIAFTIASAIIGQAAGARLERRRLSGAQQPEHTSAAEPVSQRQHSSAIAGQFSGIAAARPVLDLCHVPEAEAWAQSLSKGQPSASAGLPSRCSDAMHASLHAPLPGSCC